MAGSPLINEADVGREPDHGDQQNRGKDEHPGSRIAKGGTDFRADDDTPGTQDDRGDDDRWAEGSEKRERRLF